MANFFVVTGRWGKRPETAQTLAERLSCFLNELTQIDPLFCLWLRTGMRHRSVVPRIVTLPSPISEIRDWIDECSTFSAWKGRKTHCGYSVNAYTPQEEALYALLALHSNIVHLPDFSGNHICLTFNLLETAPPGEYPPARRMLLGLVEAWDVEWARFKWGAYADPGDQIDPTSPVCKKGWLVYLGGQHADRSVDEQSVCVEALPNGARLLTAREAAFGV